MTGNIIKELENIRTGKRILELREAILLSELKQAQIIQNPSMLLEVQKEGEDLC